MSSTEQITPTTDSQQPTREIFDRFFTKSISYPSNKVDAVIGFFEKRGFDKNAAISVASVLLEQSVIDGVNVFELLDKLKGYDNIKLNSLVTAILNNSRSKISKLGYRQEREINQLEYRNVIV
jgi:hypothetical protein